MNKYIKNSIASKKSDPFHYTPENVVQALLKYIPEGKSYLDAGSGKNKVWFNNLKGEKYECEIDDGCDFYIWHKEVDWVVGNPPFSEGWKFLDKASTIAKEGIGFLGNINFFNSLTPRRLQLLKSRGLYISKIVVLNIPLWYGRYYFLIFSRNKNDFIEML